VQEQQQQIVEKDKAIDALEKENKDIKERLLKLEALYVNGGNTVTLTSANLGQNTPNPVSGTTTIRYQVPSTAKTAAILLTNSKGQQLKAISLTNRGIGQVSLDIQALASGTYNYTLYVDGRQADTKRLVIAR
jgi:hypothetical protein